MTDPDHHPRRTTTTASSLGTDVAAGGRRHRRGHRRAAEPLFLLALLLVAVLMAVSNIRGAVRRLPFHGDTSRLDNNVRVPPAADRRTSNDLDGRTDRVAEETGPGATGPAAGRTDALDEVVRTSPQRRRSPAPPVDVVPTSNNTVVTMISMGRLVETFVVERCVRSLRLRGLFTGPVLLFTDEAGYGPYSRTMAWDAGTRVVRGRHEDLHPTWTDEGPDRNAYDGGGSSGNGTTVGRPPQPIQYAQEKMVYKRFKTHHFKYIDAIPGLAETVRFVLYVDVDNIIGAPLEGFFADYHKTVTAEHSRWKEGNLTTISTDGDGGGNLRHDDAGPAEFISFISMFRDSHLRGKMHSGVILYDRLFEGSCTAGWRHEMDTFWHSSDQTLLLRVLANYSEYKCVALSLPPKHLAFASKRLMRQRGGGRLPTFMHITNYRIKKMMDDVTTQEDFVRHVLYITDNETMGDNGIGWEQVLPPGGGTRGAPLL